MIPGKDKLGWLRPIDCKMLGDHYEKYRRHAAKKNS